MASSWDLIGNIASVAQLTGLVPGLDAVKLIVMIVKAAKTARMQRKNCRRFAQHLNLIGNLLKQLSISELMRYPETREPLEQLDDALRRSYILVNSCQDRSYLYRLTRGRNIVNQFREAQNEIDQFLKIIPLIALVDYARRVRKRAERAAAKRRAERKERAERAAAKERAERKERAAAKKKAAKEEDAATEEKATKTSTA